MFSLPVCKCMNGLSADTYKLMQYAKMKAIPVLKGFSLGVWRAPSQCCLCLVRPTMWLGTLQRIYFLHFMIDFSLLSLFCKCLSWHAHSSSLVVMHLMLREQRMFVCTEPAPTYCCTKSVWYMSISQINGGHAVQCLRPSGRFNSIDSISLDMTHGLPKLHFWAHSEVYLAQTKNTVC